MDNTRQVLAKQYAYVSNLNHNIIESIRDYTGNSYRDMNLRLRNKEFLGEYHDIVDNLDRAFQGVPSTDQPILVYRGIDTEKFIADIQAYLSTSYDIDEVYSYTGKNCCLLRIVISSGSKILPLEDISETPLEKEILLPRSGEFKITNLHYEDTLAIYDLIYIPENSVQITPNITNINQIKIQLNDEEWINRIVDLISIDEIQLFGVEDSVKALIETSFAHENVPQSAINDAIVRLENISSEYK
jgi:hypothetical protein